MRPADILDRDKFVTAFGMTRAPESNLPPGLDVVHHNNAGIHAVRDQQLADEASGEVEPMDYRAGLPASLSHY